MTRKVFGICEGCGHALKKAVGRKIVNENRDVIGAMPDQVQRYHKECRSEARRLAKKAAKKARREEVMSDGK